MTTIPEPPFLPRWEAPPPPPTKEASIATFAAVFNVPDDKNFILQFPSQLNL